MVMSLMMHLICLCAASSSPLLLFSDASCMPVFASTLPLLCLCHASSVFLLLPILLSPLLAFLAA